MLACGSEFPEFGRTDHHDLEERNNNRNNAMLNKKTAKSTKTAATASDPNADLFALLKFIGTGKVSETFVIGKRMYGNGVIRKTRPLSSDAKSVRMLELSFTSSLGKKLVGLSVVATDPSTVPDYQPDKNINVYLHTRKGNRAFGEIATHITKVPASISELTKLIARKLSRNSHAVATASDLHGLSLMYVQLPYAIYHGGAMKNVAELGKVPAKKFKSLLDIYFKRGVITKEELQTLREMKDSEFKKNCIKAFKHDLKKQQQSEATASKSATRATIIDQIRECKTNLADAMEEITELQRYLTSNKFHDDPTVQVRDVLTRLAPVKSSLLSGIGVLAPAMATAAVAGKCKNHTKQDDRIRYPETQAWSEYQKVYARIRREVIAEGDKELFGLMQRFNADMLDLHVGAPVDLQELKLDAHDLKMHATKSHKELVPLVTKIVDEYEKFLQEGVK